MFCKQRVEEKVAMKGREPHTLKGYTFAGGRKEASQGAQKGPGSEGREGPDKGRPVRIAEKNSIPITLKKRHAPINADLLIHEREKQIEYEDIVRSHRE